MQQLQYIAVAITQLELIIYMILSYIAALPLFVFFFLNRSTSLGFTRGSHVTSASSGFFRVGAPRKDEAFEARDQKEVPRPLQPGGAVRGR